MRKKILINGMGVAAIMIAVALNLRHAGNDYGLQNNSLWSIVGAQTTSTNSGCTNNTKYYCLATDCVYKENCHLEHTCYIISDVGGLAWYTEEVCDYYLGTNYSTCSTVLGNSSNYKDTPNCGYCSQFECVKKSF